MIRRRARTEEGSRREAAELGMAALVAQHELQRLNHYRLARRGSHVRHFHLNFRWRDLDLFGVRDVSDDNRHPHIAHRMNAFLGPALSVPSTWFVGPKTRTAVGFISTSSGPGGPFPATWDLIEVTPDGSSGASPAPAKTAFDAPVRAANAGAWTTVAPASSPRQEVSYVKAGGRFYLAWGRNATQQEAYNPVTNTWKTLATPLPPQLDHIQGVAVGGKIYYIGGLIKYPSPETGTVWIYDPKTDTFSSAAPMPAGRERGAGGVAVYDGKIYYAGGLHGGVAVPDLSLSGINLGSAPIGSLELGDLNSVTSPKTFDVAFDDVAYDGQYIADTGAPTGRQLP